MIPKAIMNLIDRYNEKGVFLQHQNKYYWFNGFRFESMKEIQCNYDYYMIQIQIKTKTHSYIFSKNKISHFNGEKWTILKVSNLLNSEDSGTMYYNTCTFTSWVVNMPRTDNHGILFCIMSSNYYLIDFDGNLSITRSFMNLWNTIIRSSRKNIKVFSCSDHWE